MGSGIECVTRKSNAIEPPAAAGAGQTADQSTPKIANRIRIGIGIPRNQSKT
jgi:hypothetical protein